MTQLYKLILGQRHIWAMIHYIKNRFYPPGVTFWLGHDGSWLRQYCTISLTNLRHDSPYCANLPLNYPGGLYTGRIYRMANSKCHWNLFFYKIKITVTHTTNSVKWFPSVFKCTCVHLDTPSAWCCLPPAWYLLGKPLFRQISLEDYQTCSTHT